ncbi:MAG TPA: tetratricopeptide repeat protein [Polyangiaceae bacterium]|jgi:TolA-binding protein|nr:tetratricopeptide repeat protein [Polyangiaceae bacterium]
MDLHPEELIDREATGELSPADRERLDAHLRQCPACRMERRVRNDFRRVADGTHAEVRALIARALVPGRERTARRRARGTRLRFALVAAALLLGLSGLAAAASGWSLWRGASGEAVDGAPTGAGALTAPSARRGPPSIEAPAALADSPSAVPSIALAAPLPLGGTATSEARATRAIAKAEQAKRSMEPALREADVLAEDAARLFDDANAARRRGDHGEAETAYGRLMAAHPGSPEARESLVALGRMLLDDGAPARALPRFDEYVRRGGALTAEAMLGRALALGRLGRTEDERSAWSMLAGAYPDGVYAERARARLAELGR